MISAIKYILLGSGVSDFNLRPITIREIAVSMPARELGYARDTLKRVGYSVEVDYNGLVVSNRHSLD